eukprot:CAMPEP_0198674052 /NCGR_PEP_ID=MMETSP1467-20131203/97717_1 /TAXON_ID=1462469 /ORGANISM="unid. sp., Strain CCMP2135" /LENGTH=520 /DNA_ID=CAMNT_0044410941 /DNA_START=37 /DNA_END=1599 /DNA_ORIENTATION=+
MSDKIPVTIITGFLGAGKTTLVNEILSSMDHGFKFAIIENEFGDVGVDDGVLKQSSEDQIIEMMNGCVCCTVRSDLVKVLKELGTKRKGQFDAVIIETTGLADPAPVAQTFFVDDDMSELFRLDGIVTVVDSKHAMEHLDEVKPEGVENEAVEQIAFADRILLNKTDLVDETYLQSVEKEIKGINHYATTYRTQQSKIDPTLLLNINAFSLDRVVAMDPEFLDTDGEHEHDKSVSSISFKFDGEVNVDRLQGREQIAFADRILLNKTDLVENEYLEKLEKKIKGMNHSASVFRTQQSKIDPKQLLNINAFSLDRVVAMDPEFLDTDGEHEHDKSVSSISFKFDGEVNVDRLQAFIQELLSTKANDLFRYKGLLAVKGMDRKFLFQGVHMLFQGTFDNEYPWKKDEPRECRFVFIGRNLNHDEIKKGFLRCKVENELRFAVGDRVLAQVEGGFKPGVILKLWDEANPYRILITDGEVTAEEGGFKPGVILKLWDEGNPYRISVDGTEVWAPDDVEDYVKAA